MPVKRSRQAHSTCCCNFNARFFFRLSGVQYLVSPQQRPSHVGHMRPYLMGAAGVQCYLQQGQPIFFAAAPGIPLGWSWHPAVAYQIPLRFFVLVSRRRKALQVAWSGLGTPTVTQR